MSVFNKKYKISSVTDLEGILKSEYRIGRIGEFSRIYSNDETIICGVPLYFHYMGEELIGKMLRTSWVITAEESDDGKTLVVQTENSIYTFDVVD